MSADFASGLSARLRGDPAARRVLITGAGGYIGGHACLAALDRGLHVEVIDNFSTGFRWAVPEGVAIHEGDVGDTAFVRRCIEAAQPDAVFHFAGSVRVEESVADPDKYYTNNLLGALSVGRAVLETGVPRLVFSSTAAVYSPEAASPISERAPRDPVSPYGRSKLYAEGVLSDLFTTGGSRLHLLRYFNVSGADRERRAGQNTVGATHLMKVAAEVARGQRPVLPIFGDDYETRDGTCIRDFIHVSDLVDAHFEVIATRTDPGSSTVHNVGYGAGYTVLEVARAFSDVLGRELPTERAPRRPGDLMTAVADNRRLLADTGWRPRFADLHGMIDDILRWESLAASRTGA